MISGSVADRPVCPPERLHRTVTDKALFQQMLSGRWIKDKRNLMITGPCGVGKTWLACALAQAGTRIATVERVGQTVDPS